MSKYTIRHQEFIGNREFFHDQGIYYKVKAGVTKVAYGEQIIKILKQHIYRHAHHTNSRDWVTILPTIVHNLNLRRLKVLNGLTPNDFQTKFDDTKRSARKVLAGQPSLEKQAENQSKYDAKKHNIKIGNFVFASLRARGHGGAFARAFRITVRIRRCLFRLNCREES